VKCFIDNFVRLGSRIRNVNKYPAFVRASQNVAVATTLMDTLPAPSNDQMDKVYCQLNNSVNIAATSQAERSLQHRAEVSVSSPGRSKVGRQKAAMEPPVVGTTSSPAQILARVRLSHLARCPSPNHAVSPTRGMGMHSPSSTRRTHVGVDGTNGRDTILALRDWGQRHSEAMCVIHVYQNISGYRVLLSTTMARQTTNVWLEDYHLTCRAGGANNDLFIIQFNLNYLADSTRAWLDHY
jgi:hypothetical protein